MQGRRSDGGDGTWLATRTVPWQPQSMAADRVRPPRGHHLCRADGHPHDRGHRPQLRVLGWLEASDVDRPDQLLESPADRIFLLALEANSCFRLLTDVL